jgi:DNA modification methylase
MNVECKCGRCGKTYQAPVQGGHRLKCGDSTDPADVQDAMAGGKAAVVITDPPYNVGFDYGESVDDEKQAAEYVAWSKKWFALAKQVSQSCVVVTTGITNLPMWIADVERTHRILAWVKENQCSRNYIGKTSGFNVWEPVLVFGKAKKCVARDSFSIPISVQAEAEGHPCPKAMKAWVWLLENFSDAGDVLFEPFSGSGTTIIAAEKTGRTCCALEIEPRFVDLAIIRWQNFTGRKAVLERTGEPFKGGAT